MDDSQSSESFVSPIEQNGNFFIMDSEQVISNPYQELQTEALDTSKKTSLTERLTSVRNNVCEHNLRTQTTHLEKQRTHSLNNLFMDTSNLRYEHKVMDINRRKNDLTMQQRIDPKKDFSFDTRQINNTAKRLGVTSEESFYLDRKLKYPIRSNISKDHNAKPFIKKAKQSMLNHTINKKLEKSELERSQTAHTFERATTAHTISTTVPSPEPSVSPTRKPKVRRGSKSAPIPQKNGFQSRLSALDECDSKLPSIATGSLTAEAPTRNSKSHVKFQVKEPAPFRQSTPDKLTRAKTYYSGMGRTTRSYSQGWDSDSDDDYTYTDKIDLRALFFGDKSQSGESKSAITGISGGTTTPRTMLTRMSSEIPPLLRNSLAKQPKVTEEQMLADQADIKNKIDKFLGNIQKDKKKHEVKKAEKKEEIVEEKVYDEKDIKAKAAILLSVFSKPLMGKQWGFTPPKSQESLKAKEAENGNKLKEKPSSAQTVKEKKNLWDLIRTNVQSGDIHRKYTANDLLLQQLTGILVQTENTTKAPIIPIHAASRALRHTPTFKMKRVVEELMKQRTRYEQQEVEKLQNKEDGMFVEGGAEAESGVQHYPPRAWATPCQELEQES